MECFISEQENKTLYSLSVYLVIIVHYFPVRFHLSCAEDTLATIEELAGGAMAELIEDEDKIASSTTYPTLTRYSVSTASFNSTLTLDSELQPN